MAQNRASCNAIKSLQLDYSWIITEISEIKQEAVSYFYNSLQTHMQDFVQVSTLVFNDLLNSQYLEFNLVGMVDPIIGTEIMDALFSLPASKARGPDGFTMEFYKAAWPVIRTDFIVAVQ